MSVILDFQVNGVFASKVGGVGTAIKYFPRLLGPSIGVSPSTPSTTSAVGALLLPPSNVLNAQSFHVYATGSVSNTTGGDTATIVVQAVTSSGANPTYSTMATQAIVLAAGVPQSWAFDVILYGDSISGKVGGEYLPMKQGVAAARATSTSVLSGINFNIGANTGAGAAPLGSSPFGLVVGVSFTTGTDSANTASLNQFQVAGA